MHSRSHSTPIFPELREDETDFVRTLCKLTPFTPWNADEEIAKVVECFGDDAMEKVLHLGLDEAFFCQYIKVTTSAPTAIQNFRTVGRFYEENSLRNLPRQAFVLHYVRATTYCGG